MTTARRSLPSWLSWSSWFSNRSLRAAQRQKSRDFADYGTAFGLDMSKTPDLPPLTRSGPPEAAKAVVTPPVTAPAR